jgi:hypothetical protein
MARTIGERVRLPRQAEQHGGLSLLDRLGEIEAPLAPARQPRAGLRVVALVVLHRAPFDEQPLRVEDEDARPRLFEREALAHHPLLDRPGHARPAGARAIDHDHLVAQLSPAQRARAHQARERHGAGSLDVVVERG